MLGILNLHRAMKGGVIVLAFLLAGAPVSSTAASAEDLNREARVNFHACMSDPSPPGWTRAGQARICACYVGMTVADEVFGNRLKDAEVQTVRLACEQMGGKESEGEGEQKTPVETGK